MKRILLSAAGALLLVTIMATPSLKADSYDSSEGKLVYDKKCAMCHGKTGEPNKMGSGSASFNDPVWQDQTAMEDIIKVVIEGKGTMKGMEGKLSHEEMKGVARHVKQMGKGEVKESEVGIDP